MSKHKHIHWRKRHILGLVLVGSPQQGCGRHTMHTANQGKIPLSFFRTGCLAEGAGAGIPAGLGVGMLTRTGWKGIPREIGSGGIRGGSSSAAGAEGLQGDSSTSPGEGGRNCLGSRGATGEGVKGRETVGGVHAGERDADPALGRTFSEIATARGGDVSDSGAAAKGSFGECKESVSFKGEIWRAFGVLGEESF